MSNAPEMPLVNLIAARLTSADETMSFQSMATLISPNLAITPDHIFQPFDRIAPRTNIRVKLHFDARTDVPSEAEATVIARDPAVDFAILQLGPSDIVYFPLYNFNILSPEAPPRGSSWKSSQLIPGSSINGVEVNGTIIGLETYDGHEHLHLSASHPAEPGSSGAPIVVNNQVVGIMARRGMRENDWYAIPVTAMLKSRFGADLKAILAAPLPNETTTTKADDTLDAEGKTITDDATLYQRLSPSSKRAFNHAEGLRIALERDVVHMEHLLAGLFEKTDGPTQRVLKEAGIDQEKLHQMLEEEAERDFPQSDQYTPADLNALPRMSAHAREALLAANEASVTHGAKQIQSRHLIYGALSITHCGMIQRLLTLGVDKDKIDLTPDKLPDLTAPQIAGYQSDAPAEQDLLGITHEVQALCAVLSAKDVQPPLSLGLFGEWGSGKSSFMRQMELQINANRADAQTNPDSPYCRDIVQLWFNAWHYIDAELWASLAQKIFDGLKESLAVRALPQPPEEVEYERAKLLAQSLKAKEELASAQQTQQQLEAQVQQTEAQLAALSRGEGKLKISPLELLDDVVSAAEAKHDDKKKAEKTEEKVAEKIQAAANVLNADAEKVQVRLVEVGMVYKLFRAICLAIRHVKNRGFWLSVILFVVAGFLLWSWLQSRYPLLTFGGALLSAISPFIVQAVRALAFVSDAIQIREKTLQERRTKLQEKLQAQKETVKDKTQAVQAAEQELENLRADKQIASFIKQRSASTDYAQYRGVIAKVRDDFDQLSKLLATEREQRKNDTLSEEEALLPRIDRIILYIDDLDRCPENKVVEVLQAVHLLLAFPLFVVVVGVDPRWLLHSLKQHSAAFRATAQEEDGLSDEESTHWQSTPMNYLEKIFQIPFTLRPMAEPGFQELIEKLAAAPPAKIPVSPATKSNVKAAPVNIEPIESKSDPQPAPTPPPTDVTEPEQPTPPLPVPPPIESEKPPPPTIINPEYLRIEDWERQTMKQLYGLIPSPRAAKRFVNLYRLLRVSVAADKRAAFISRDNPEQHRAALLLLAMLIGYPSETTDILRQLRVAKTEQKWWEFWGTIRPEPQGTGVVQGSPQAAEEKNWQELKKKLDHEDVRAMIPDEQSCEHFITWANEVARYSFQSGRVLLG